MSTSIRISKTVQCRTSSSRSRHEDRSAPCCTRAGFCSVDPALRLFAASPSLLPASFFFAVGATVRVVPSSVHTATCLRVIAHLSTACS